MALSCKERGFCPSCLGRRMSDTALHLEESVLPAVRVRHRICSLPWGLRERVDQLLRRTGRRLEREGEEPLPELFADEPGLASCYAAAA